jgi:hypothetical protein
VEFVPDAAAAKTHGNGPGCAPMELELEGAGTDRLEGELPVPEHVKCRNFLSTRAVDHQLRRGVRLRDAQGEAHGPAVVADNGPPHVCRVRREGPVVGVGSSDVGQSKDDGKPQDQQESEPTDEGHHGRQRGKGAAHLGLPGTSNTGCT